ncbi:MULTISPECIES: efflux RND transporter permease subunit [Pseudanabaena]|uniref:Acriflavin resistance protein n=2 Tax=Pseudanabaena TaxID=1152 RepID=L8MYS7_9CYAN|nr:MULTISPECIES: efflux RND transporter permease subunit [Pseudanabaena]ELS31610.1 acriflavin resistance protein [Pseudanabaena biceps PCC 7429]MDG3496129.1 efflux RND transporter permease subunit [Pseudanabaena catenata USMAC16]
MNLSKLFITRPVMTTLVMIGILIFGIMSYALLPISALPNVEYPFISVSASLPGGTPETMASAVAAPLERQFTEIAGLNSFNSTSATGSTNISLQFDFSRSVASAAKDVQAAISAAAGQLPADMPKPPTYRKVNPSVSPILYLYLYSETLPIYEVDESAEITIAQPISAINGVAQVQVYGQKQYAVRVQLDPRAVAARGIGLDRIKTIIQSGNVTLPTGSLSGKDKSYLIQANGQLNNAAEYGELIVSYQNGAPVRLRELGDVIDSIQNNKVSNLFSDRKVANQPSIVLAVQPQPGANTVQIVDAVKAMLPTLQAQIPKSIEMGILYDRSLSIRASIQDVQFTLILSIALVVMVIFLFLRDLPATMIPSMALPIAIIGTFAVMYLLGYSLDNLSLMALTLSVGFVVDDAIVVLENIVRHREMGEPPMVAALKGSQEVSFTILSMTLSLVAVFIPIIFMGGLIGKLFHEFAIVISVAILVSGFVSLSLTPMLCSRFLRSSHHQQNRLAKFLENAFDSLLKGYEWTLKPVLKHHRVTMIASFLLLFLTFYTYMLVPKGLIPNEDTGQLMVNTKAAQDISFDDMLKHQQAVVDIIRKDPNVAALNSTVGAAGPNASVNNGRITVRLKPRDQRPLSADEIIQELTPKLRRVTGIQAFLRSPPAIPIGGQQTNSTYQFTLQSLNLQDLRDSIPKLLDKIKTIPGLRGVDTDLQLRTPQIEVKIDRDKAALLGITATQIEKTLGNAYGSSQVSTMFTPDNQFYVILELKPEFQKDATALSMIYVSDRNGRSVPLSAIASIIQNVGPLTVNHLAQLPSATISFDTQLGTSLNDATDAIKKVAKEVLPDTVTPSFQGSAQVFAQSFNDLGLLLLISIVVIYLILGILYEDFIHPITILSGLPSAGFGALLTLWIFQVELNLYSFIGIILLVGIVKKNGIMLVDFAIDAQRRENKSPREAIYAACIVRFRPIMMTTMAALIGTLPIALGTGTGSEARRPLGIAIVGGLIFSQVLTLYLTPVFYTYMEAWRQKFVRPKSNQRHVTSHDKIKTQ